MTIRIDIDSHQKKQRFIVIISISLSRNVVLWLKKTSTESLQIELVTEYDTNDA